MNGVGAIHRCGGCLRWICYFTVQASPSSYPLALHVKRNKVLKCSVNRDSTLVFRIISLWRVFTFVLS